MNKAFVLGAGLGERLRPLTEQLPKPLIPVFHKPLITYAFDHLRGVGVREFVINTHHLAAQYEAAFPSLDYEGAKLHFRYEPVRLETAGGIANVRDLLDGVDSFVVYNGDILTDLPLQKLIDEHEARQNLITLALRSHGPALHVGFDAAAGLVTDIRNKLGTGNSGTHLFTGIYVVHPRFFDFVTPGKVESVIPIFLDRIQAGDRIGGVVVDEGQWWDLGTRDAYIDAHRHFNGLAPLPAVAQGATVSENAKLRRLNVVGPGVVVEDGAELEDCVLWPGARVEAGSRLRRCIVRSGIVASGEGVNRDY